MASFGSWRWRVAALGLVTLGAAGARAEEPAPSPTVPASPAPAAAPADVTPAAAQPASLTAADLRRDPNGKTGITPVAEAIVRGDAALLARDFPAATSAYQEAIKVEPQKAAGHLRMVSLHLLAGDLDRATEVLATAERFTAGDAKETIQVLALRAMLLERRALLSEANLAWSAYAMLGRAGGPALGDSLAQQAILTTCADRKTVITRATERQAAYAKVRERIEKGLADANLSPDPGTILPPK